jgi:hypothetical protein
MKVIDKVINRYIDFLIVGYDDEKIRFNIGDRVTFNWKAVKSMRRSKKDVFKVIGYYDCGVKTECGEYIANFWLKKVEPRVNQSTSHK